MPGECGDDPLSPAASGPTLQFRKTGLKGAWLVEPWPAHDERGFFMRTFCARQFAARGLETCFVQHSRSSSLQMGTLRGMHFQRPPDDEVKLVSCLRGAIWDVIVDLRPRSATYLRWEGFVLSEENRLQLYVPKGCAHGFQTLLPNSEVSYLISAFYAPAAAAGVRYDDPQFGISWPLTPVAVSERDTAWPDYKGAAE